MSVLRAILGLAAGVAAMMAASPASAQFYFKSKDLSGPPVTGAEPGIVGQALPGATPEELRAALIWNLRAALNVAALQCQFEPTLLTLSNYNSMITDHAGELAASYDTLGKYFRRTHKTAKEGQAAFDQFGTRVYSGFSTVAAQRIFCQTAGKVGEDVVFAKRGELDQVAMRRMRELRNALTPWGEQQFPSTGYGYMVNVAPTWTELANERCWRRGAWDERRCGPVYVRPVGAPAANAVANRG
ncbi:hypothetical protein [Sphingomonas sp.]